MERYVFKIAGPSGKWIKIFMSTKEGKALTMEALLEQIIERFPSLGKRSVVGLKYLDGNDWFELLADDLDSFIDMIETATVEREHLKRITLKVNELALMPPRSEIAGRTSQKRLRTSTSPVANSEKSTTGVDNARKKQKRVALRCFDEQLSTTEPVFQYETATQKFFNKLDSEKKQQQEIIPKKENELLDLEMSFKVLVANTKPLCSNCHTSGHNKTMRSFSACISAQSFLL